MADPHDELANLVRDTRGHAEWLRDSKETEVLRAAGEVKLIRPPPRQPPPAHPMSPPPAQRVQSPQPKPTTPPAHYALEAMAPIGTSSDPETRLKEIREVLGDCQRCKLCTTRHKIVYGVGKPKAQLMFVGEGPGADEDRRGEPFVGAAGRLLTKMIGAMGLARPDVYIANCVKCRPPENRTPMGDELLACMPFLHAQIEAIQPKIIVSLGKVATQSLLGEHVSITRIRGTWLNYRKGPIKMLPTFHPSYLLRVPEDKRLAWADLQLVMKELGLPIKQAAPTSGASAGNANPQPSDDSAET